MTPTYTSATPAMTALPDPRYHADLYAGVPSKRLVAWFVDVVFTMLITAALVPFTLFTALLYLPLLYLVVSFVYRWITLTRGSATPGMRLAAIELRNRDGNRLDAGEAALHTLGYTMSFAVFPAQIVSVALMMISERGQGLTDHIMGTAMLNRRASQ
ncbi:MAG: putative RDD family membrane protein YckC [Sulfitobacter sp.]|jgi:uncharacterized RDD family membrane protein YckC